MIKLNATLLTILMAFAALPVWGMDHSYEATISFYIKMKYHRESPKGNLEKILTPECAGLTVAKLEPTAENKAAEAIFAQSFDGSARDALYDAKATSQIALLDNTVIGIAIYRDLTNNDATRRYLYNFAIAQSERGKGYGKKFMNILIEQAVTAKNIAAFELEATPESKDFYRKLKLFNTQDPESLNMVKDLRSSCSPTDTN